MLSANGRQFGRRRELRSLELEAPPFQAVREVPAADPRQVVRKRIYKKGKLFFGDDFAFVLDCIIADMTDNGARVQIDSRAAVADEFWLVHLRDHVAYRATIAWRRHGSVGLKLTSRHDLRKPDTTEMKTLSQYCDDHRLRIGDARS